MDPSIAVVSAVEKPRELIKQIRDKGMKVKPQLL